MAVQPAEAEGVRHAAVGLAAQHVDHLLQGQRVHEGVQGDFALGHVQQGVFGAGGVVLRVELVFRRSAPGEVGLVKDGLGQGRNVLHF